MRARDFISIAFSDSSPVLSGYSTQQLNIISESAGDYDSFHRAYVKNLSLPQWTQTLEIYGAHTARTRAALTEGVQTDAEKSLFSTFSNRAKNCIESARPGDHVALLHLSTLNIPGDKIYARLNGFIEPKKIVNIVNHDGYQQFQFEDGSKYPEKDGGDAFQQLQTWNMTKLFASRDAASQAAMFYKLIGNSLSDAVNFQVNVEINSGDSLNENDQTRDNIIATAQRMIDRYSGLSYGPAQRANDHAMSYESNTPQYRYWTQVAHEIHRLESVVDEMALKSYTPLGKFDKPGPFKDPDYRLVTHPVHIQKVGKFLERTPYQFRIFVSNLPGKTRYRETGAKTPQEIEQIFGADTAKQILRDTSDTITIIFIGNYGSERVIMTPWIMAHRMGHAVTATERGTALRARSTTPWNRAETLFFTTINELLKNRYGKVNTDPHRYWDAGRPDRFNRALTPEYNALFNAIGTQRSSREGQIKRPYEFMYELFAQYIKDGVITLNPLPINLGYGRQAWGRPTKYLNIKPEFRDQISRQETVDRLARQLEQLYDGVLQDCVGRVFVM